MSRHHDSRKDLDPAAELENQFILRMPEEPARVLREAINSGVNNLKDRFSVRLENDMRYGEVRVDHWLMHAKVVDLPTIIESLKTIDCKSFYKTADICQMLICKEEPDVPSTDEESPTKNKKKDPNKVDKKFLWPHGVTPPTKNVRRRRFRKTLKKKYVEAPEIEKEVKRLLRVDNEAVHVKWELICEDDEPSKSTAVAGPSGSGGNSNKSGTSHDEKMMESQPSSQDQLTQQSADLGEHDIFGGAVSDSEEEEEETNINVELDDNSRLSQDDSRMSDSSSLQGTQPSSSKFVTSFSKDMFSSPVRSRKTSVRSDAPLTPTRSQPVSAYGFEKHEPDDFGDSQMSRESISNRLEEIKGILQDLHTQRSQREREVSSMENVALKQRFQEMLDNIIEQITLKEMEADELRSFLRNE